jgi:hypothetical protein
MALPENTTVTPNKAGVNNFLIELEQP